MSSPFFSIIIPVYNVAPYLRECLDSVLNQTFTDWEAICVDDGSTDGSGEILDEYAKRDGRIRVFHKPNGGVSSARGKGVQCAEAEWGMFLDGDDAIADDALSILSVYVSDHVDLIEALHKADSIFCRSLENVHVEFADKVEYAKQLLTWNQHWKTGPWCKLFRLAKLKATEALNMPKWIKWGEDAVMCVKYSCALRKALRINVPIYYYRTNPQGATATLRGGAQYFVAYLQYLEMEILSRCDHLNGFDIWSTVAFNFFIPMFLKMDWDSRNQYMDRIFQAARAQVNQSMHNKRLRQFCLFAADCPRFIQPCLRSCICGLLAIRGFLNSCFSRSN